MKQINMENIYKMTIEFLSEYLHDEVDFKELEEIKRIISKLENESNSMNEDSETISYKIIENWHLIHEEVKSEVVQEFMNALISEMILDERLEG